MKPSSWRFPFLLLLGTSSQLYASQDLQPELYGFSLNDNAKNLIGQYDPILQINGLAVIVERKLSPPLEQVLFKYSGDTISSLELEIAATGSCEEVLAFLASRFGNPIKSHKGEMFWAQWPLDGATVTATGNCTGGPVLYKAILARGDAP